MMESNERSRPALGLALRSSGAETGARSRDVPHAVSCSQATIQRIVDSMQAALPAEGLTVLGGVRRAGVLTVNSVIPIANTAAAADQFAAAPAAFADALRCLAHEDFLGFAHSHPNAEPLPSTRDASELWRECLHAILGNADGIWRVRWYWHAASGFVALAETAATP